MSRMRLLLQLVVLLVPVVHAAAEEVYLTVGPGGQRMIARDGLNWGKYVAWGPPKHDQNDLNVATFFKGAAYVGGGYYSARMTATRDGMHWSEGELPKGSPIFGLEVLDEALYAVTLRGQVYRSEDGEVFELIARAEMPSKTHWIRSTAVGNELIVGSGDFGPAITFNPKSNQITVTQMAGQTEKKATLQRVAFGNGTFVVGGQDGLLAASKDGITWQNNHTNVDRGDISTVIWTGKIFLASAKSGGFVSQDGIDWQKMGVKLPRKMVRAGEWIYGWSWPPHRLQRSRNGIKWQPVPNEKEYHVKDVAFGTLDRKPNPPDLPQKVARRKKK